MDTVLNIALYMFAGLGALMLMLIIWVIIEDWGGRKSYPPMVPVNDELRRDEAFQYLDNEVRGQMRYENSMVRGRTPLKEPTLKGRVDAIEKHLGIVVSVKPATQPELVVKKGKR